MLLGGCGPSCLPCPAVAGEPVPALRKKLSSKCLPSPQFWAKLVPKTSKVIVGSSLPIIHYYAAAAQKQDCCLNKSVISLTCLDFAFPSNQPWWTEVFFHNCQPGLGSGEPLLPTVCYSTYLLQPCVCTLYHWCIMLTDAMCCLLLFSSAQLPNCCSFMAFHKGDFLSPGLPLFFLITLQTTSFNLQLIWHHEP